MTAATAAALLMVDHAVGAPVTSPTHCLQVKFYDADYVEAQGYKSAIAVADEIRTLLEGSKKAGTCKGWEDIPAFSAVPQVWRCGM